MTNEFQLVEKRELREEFIGRMEVLDKVGDLILLPSTEFATTELSSQPLVNLVSASERVRQYHYLT